MIESPLVASGSCPYSNCSQGVSLLSPNNDNDTPCHHCNQLLYLKEPTIVGLLRYRSCWWMTGRRQQVNPYLFNPWVVGTGTCCKGTLFDTPPKSTIRLWSPWNTFEAHKLTLNALKPLHTSRGLFVSLTCLMPALHSRSPLSDMSLLVHCMCQPHVVQYIKSSPLVGESLEFSLQISFARLVVLLYFMSLMLIKTLDILC